MNWYKTAQFDIILYYISKVENKDLAVTGDCGMFAFALTKILSENGENCEIGICLEGNHQETPDLEEVDNDEPYVNHVVVIYNGGLYDALGSQTSESIQQNYYDHGEMAIVGYPVSQGTLSFISHQTNYSNDWTFYYDQMRDGDGSR